MIETILSAHQKQLGKDFPTYRNHVYRVFLLCLKLDNDPSNEDKYAIAAAYHDLGIWTHNTFDYLAPSIQLAQEYLTNNNNETWSAEVAQIIEMHHKTSKYEGAFEKTVETFRKSDWIDVSMGIMKFKLTGSEIKEISTRFPTLGFHRFLVIQSIKNFVKHPLNPLPMFKK